MDWIQEPLEQIQWAILHWIAGLLWSVDRLFLIASVLIHSLRRWITDPDGLITLVLTQFLQDPTGSQLLKTYMAGGVLLALLLAAFWFFLRPLLGAGVGAPVEVRKVFLWLAVAGFLFGSGPAFASDLEHFRAELSSGAYRVAVQVNQQVSGQGYNNTHGEVPVTGSQPFSPTVTLFPQTTHLYGVGNPPEYTGIDVAAAYLLAGQEDINGTANGGTGLPGGFEFAYFTSCDASGQTCAQPWPSGYDESNRQAALAQALNGVVRMETGLAPSLFALLQAFIFLALALAAAILFFSLPLSLVFAFFNTTEIIALAVVKAYIGLLVKTHVAGTILALFMGFLLGWNEGNLVAFLGMSLLTVLFTWQLSRMSVQTITESMNVVMQAIGQATGTSWRYLDPPRLAGDAVGLGATVALAAATGGTGLAVGSLVSGVGGALGMPGASTLGTAIALNYRRRGGGMGEREMEDGPTADAASSADPTAATAVGYPDVGAVSGGAATVAGEAGVIDGEWYEIRQAEHRRTRADRWLTAHNIPPLSAVDALPTNQPPISTEAAPPPPDVIRPIPLRFDGPWAERPLVDDAVIRLPPPTTENPPNSGPPLLPAPNPGIAATTSAIPSSDATLHWRAEAGAIPAALQEQAQWVAWRYEELDGRSVKVPYTPRTGHRARSNDPRTWGSATEAQDALVGGGYDGVGFMLHADDPFVGVDLDHCYDPQTGTLLPWAAEIVQTLDSYTEVSPSGTGVRIFTRGTLPPRELGRHEGPVEMYSDRRFLSVTGQHLEGTPTTVEERGAALAQVHRQVFRRRYEAPPQPATAAAPVGGDQPSLPDAAILDKVRRAKNGPSFEQLWQGDTEGYASASEADLALCGMLAFYTQDPAQIERLVAQSGLWDEKWRNRPAYRQGTIQQAIAHRSGTYSGQRPGNDAERHASSRRPPTSSRAATDTGSVLSATVDDEEKPGME